MNIETARFYSSKCRYCLTLFLYWNYIHCTHLPHDTWKHASSFYQENYVTCLLKFCCTCLSINKRTFRLVWSKVDRPDVKATGIEPLVQCKIGASAQVCWAHVTYQYNEWTVRSHPTLNGHSVCSPWNPHPNTTRALNLIQKDPRNKNMYGYLSTSWCLSL